MRRNKQFFNPSRLFSGIATLVVGGLLLAFSSAAVAEAPDYSDYVGSDRCKDCHQENYNNWARSGHPFKLMKAEEARFRPIPLPEDVNWEDVSYVIGGFKWKSRYVQTDGYIYTPSSGENQYNYLIDTWSDYHAGEVKPYNCGDCHTTGWIPDLDFDTDNDLTDNQDGMEGMHGTFFQGGIHCEECHGPGDNFSTGMQIDTSRPEGTDPTVMTGAFCGRCHQRYDGNVMPPEEENYIPASGGYIRHHEQYNEVLASPHASYSECVTCHNPHKVSQFSIVTQCEDCHSDIAASFAMTSMYDYGVECEDCHMAMATKSAKALGPYQGDVMTHLFNINTDPAASMFEEDGGRVALDSEGEGAVTLDFACKSCHETAALEELAKFAVDFHDGDKSLEDIGLDPGLTGTWWVETRQGEGILLEVGGFGGVEVFFGSFYTYDAMGGQVWLTLEMASIDGNMVNLNIIMAEGAMWGDDFNPDDVVREPFWGSGSIEFSTCGSAELMLDPSEEMEALGFTDQTFQLTRTLEPGFACPTFENNPAAAAIAATAK